MKRGRRLGELLGAVLGVLLTSHGVSQADDVARSDQLFYEGKRLLAAGQIHEACVSLEQSYALEARGGTLLNLGLCHEQEGNLARAWHELTAARELALQDGREDRVHLADEHLETLARSLAFVSPTPPADGERPLVHGAVEDTPWPTRQWTKPPVERDPLVLNMRARPSLARRWLAGVGVGGLVTSLVLGAVALREKRQIDRHCNASDECDRAGRDAATMGRAFATASSVMFGVGILGVGGWLLWPRDAGDAGKPPSSWSLRVGGRF